MIADDCGLQKILRSYGNTLLRLSAIANESSFSPKVRNNLPIIDRIIEGTRFSFAFFEI